MGEDYTYDGSPLTIGRRGEVESTERADHGNIGTGKVTLDDVAGTQAIVGHKEFTAEEDACAVPRTFTGYVGTRTYKRGTEKAGPSRFIDVNLLDLNALLGFRVLRNTDSPDQTWKRPKEPMADRLEALLASSMLNDLVFDFGLVTYPATELDENEYRGQFPLDVIRDMALVAGFNYFVYWDPDEEAPGLWFGDSNTSVEFTTNLRLSNDIADVDNATTFFPLIDAELDSDPGEVISGIRLSFARGGTYRIRSETEDEFGRRDGVQASSDIKRRAKAIALADRTLFERSNEDHSITVSTELPAEEVNLVRAGQRMSNRFTHFVPEGFAEWTWYRILELTKRPMIAPDEGLYNCRFVLSPQESAQTTACGGPFTGPAVMVQSASLACNVGNDAVFGSPTTVGNVLVAIVGTRSTQSNDLPADHTWAPLGNINLFSDAPGHAMRAFWKCADGEDTYTIGNGAGSMGTVWEVSSANIAQATITQVANHAFSDPQVVGSVAGSLHLMGIGVSIEHFTSHDNPGSGWTEDNGAFTANCDGAPFIHTAHATGSLTAQAGIDGDPHGLHQWGAIVVSFPTV